MLGGYELGGYGLARRSLIVVLRLRLNTWAVFRRCSLLIEGLGANRVTSLLLHTRRLALAIPYEEAVPETKFTAYGDSRSPFEARDTAWTLHAICVTGVVEDWPEQHSVRIASPERSAESLTRAERSERACA